MKNDFERTAQALREAEAPVTTPAKPPVLTLDVALYEQYLAEGGLTEEQKREFLEALWTIIVGFVDLGFGIHPVQQALDAQAFNCTEKEVETGGQDLIEFHSQGKKDKGQHAKITREPSEKEER